MRTPSAEKWAAAQPKEYWDTSTDFFDQEYDPLEFFLQDSSELEERAYSKLVEDVETIISDKLRQLGNSYGNEETEKREAFLADVRNNTLSVEELQRRYKDEVIEQYELWE